MSFANKGLAMADPECVRCSACVQSCPTGVLTFGQVDGGCVPRRSHRGRRVLLVLGARLVPLLLPLAALMHICARFSRFAIVPDKKKCISCNVCTSVCHQGIDVMSFANKGQPMADPECVRCSACVQSCPTGVLTFGQVQPRTGQVLGVDRLAASPVQMAEGR